MLRSFHIGSQLDRRTIGLILKPDQVYLRPFTPPANVCAAEKRNLDLTNQNEVGLWMTSRKSTTERSSNFIH